MSLQPIENWTPRDQPLGRGEVRRSNIHMRAFTVLANRHRAEYHEITRRLRGEEVNMGYRRVCDGCGRLAPQTEQTQGRGAEKLPDGWNRIKLDNNEVVVTTAELCHECSPQMRAAVVSTLEELMTRPTARTA